MGKSPGHQDWPDHKVREKRIEHAVQVEVGGQVIAQSDRTIQVDEDMNPSRTYFPRDGVVMRNLAPSPTTTDCPFKGTASYFDLKVGRKIYKDAVWTYEDPYDEHKALAGMLAFYEEKIPGLHIGVPADANH